MHSTHDKALQRLLVLQPLSAFSTVICKYGACLYHFLAAACCIYDVDTPTLAATPEVLVHKLKSPGVPARLLTACKSARTVRQ